MIGNFPITSSSSAFKSMNAGLGVIFIILK